MNSPESLRKRAGLATLSATSTTEAIAIVERAISHAANGRAGIGPLDDLNTAYQALKRATRRLEQSRLRLLRKANRNGVTQ